MANTQIIRRRIKSVKNINQITKAMELVAATKLRHAQESALQSHLYAYAAKSALADLYIAQDTIPHPLLRRSPLTARLIILFTSDRGLAGAYNTNLFKAFIKAVQDDKEKDPVVAIKVIVMGQKGAQFVSRLQHEVEVVGIYTNLPVQLTVSDIQPAVATAMKMFVEEEVDGVTILFTRFVSSVKQEISFQELLPVASQEKSEDVLMEPGQKKLLAYILPRFIEMQLYQAGLEALATEQSMRMVAMKNASDNAKDLTEDLTLTFNRARQAAITQELAEITAGA